MDLNLIGRSLIAKDEVNEKELVKAVKAAFKLGYQVVVVNTIIGAEQLEGKGCKIPEPINIRLGKEEISQVQLSSKTFKIMTRLTAQVHNNNHCARLIKSPVANNYDIIAVNPQNMKVFQNVCSSLEVDLLTFDLTKKPEFYWKASNLKQATSRGLCIEIQYAPCLRDQDSRRYTIANANHLNELLNGKNIVVSSGAKKMIELRGPRDISYLIQGLFGLKESKACITSTCSKVILHSEIRRKTGKGIVSIQELAKVTENDKWLRDACTLVVGVAQEVDSSKDSEEEIPSKRIKTTLVI